MRELELPVSLERFPRAGSLSLIGPLGIPPAPPEPRDEMPGSVFLGNSGTLAQPTLAHVISSG